MIRRAIMLMTSNSAGHPLIIPGTAALTLFSLSLSPSPHSGMCVQVLVLQLGKVFAAEIRAVDPTGSFVAIRFPAWLVAVLELCCLCVASGLPNRPPRVLAFETAAGRTTRTGTCWGLIEIEAGRMTGIEIERSWIKSRVAHACAVVARMGVRWD